MKVILISLFILPILFSCGGKEEKTTPATLKFSAGFAVTGQFDGGILVNAKSATESFQLAIDNGGNDVEVNLQDGDWTFNVIGWQGEDLNGDGVLENLTGEMRCDVATTSIAGEEAKDVTILMTAQNCEDSNKDLIVDNNIFDTTLLKDSTNGIPGQVKKIKFHPCLSSTDKSTCSNVNDLGAHLSYKIRYSANNTTNSTNTIAGAIVSDCFGHTSTVIDLQTTDWNTTTGFITNLRIPASGLTGIPLEILAFEQPGCLGSPMIYPLPNGLLAADNNLGKVNVTSATTSQLNLVVADNFVFESGTALLNETPEIICSTGGCSIDPSPGNSGAANARAIEAIHRFFGPPKGYDGYSLGSYAEAYIGGLILRADTPGTAGNSFNADNTTPGQLVINANGISSSFTYVSGASDSISVLQGQINADTQINSLLTASTAPNSSGTLYDTNTTHQFSGGRNQENQHGRRRGFFGELNLELKAIGGVLYKNGITSCSQLTNGSSYVENIPGLNGTFTINVSQGLIPLDQIFSITYPSTSHFRLQTIFSDSTETETRYLEIICGTKYGWVRSQWTDTQGTEQEEIFYDGSSSGTSYTGTSHVFNYHTYSWNGKNYRNRSYSQVTPANIYEASSSYSSDGKLFGNRSVITVSSGTETNYHSHPQGTGTESLADVTGTPTLNTYLMNAMGIIDLSAYGLGANREVGWPSLTPLSQTSTLGQNVSSFFISYVTPDNSLDTGETPVTIKGFGFGTGINVGDTVDIGGAGCTVDGVTINTLTCTTTPNTIGVKTVTVTKSDSSTASLLNGFRYVYPMPSISVVTPTYGSTQGGTLITLSGAGFKPNATVLIGSQPCTNVTVVSETILTCNTPSYGAEASLDIKITNIDGQSATLANYFFYKTPPPALLSLYKSSPIESPSSTEGVTISVGGILPSHSVNFYSSSDCSGTPSTLTPMGTTTLSGGVTLSVDGVYYFSANQFNSSYSDVVSPCLSGTRPHIFDLTPPPAATLSLVEPTSASPHFRTNPTLRTTGSFEVGDVVTIYSYDGVAQFGPCDYQREVGREKVETAGTTIDFKVNRPPGAFTLGTNFDANYYVQVTDKAGNVGPCSSTGLSYIIDNSSCVGSFTAYNQTGAGTVADPYIICTAQQLNDLGFMGCGSTYNTACSSHFALGFDIDLSAIPLSAANPFKTIGNTTNPFTGSFNGNGRSITGMVMDAAAGIYNVGMFGQTSNATISDFVLNGTLTINSMGSANVATDGYGLVAAKSSGGSFSDIRVEGSISTVSTSDVQNIGGIIGYATSSSIQYSESLVSITGTGLNHQIGGIAGTLSGGSVQDSRFNGATQTGSISSPSSNFVGGVVGFLNGGSINGAEASGSLSGSTGVGCILGKSTGTVSNLRVGNPNTCTLTGISNIGGAIGRVEGGSVSNVHVSNVTFSNTSSSFVGGILGVMINSGVSLSNSHSNTSVSGGDKVGGVVGTVHTCSSCIISNVSTGNYTVTAQSGTSEAGGIIGYVISSTFPLSNSVSHSNISSIGSGGGLIGYIDSSGVANVSNSYWRGSSITGPSAGGILGGSPFSSTFSSNYFDNSYVTDAYPGSGGSLAGMEGKTPAELTQQATFVGWDFTNVWDIIEGQTAPFFKGSHPDSNQQYNP